ncbi:hypothetical protein L0B53_18975 (plasmid) [Vibrio sp. SS-MA-C1-2]|uniref:hypothetical protein n=1 Tax=Vibrio sp. SS-MA-C1-2 TaxID=2908646 RepID=UPI001F35CF6E|nr:hypothetical protein [Vibrio sp. SS-MA-C1-2]UJF20220.1 hypothetical protein L0B53_18975 [Vibrio sp. SS-MA-C1-2]
MIGLTIVIIAFIALFAFIKEQRHNNVFVKDELPCEDDVRKWNNQFDKEFRDSQRYANFKSKQQQDFQREKNARAQENATNARTRASQAQEQYWTERREREAQRSNNQARSNRRR